MDDYDYDDDVLDDEDEYDDYEDCGWSGESGQLCDDIGSESCSFRCPYYQTMIKTLGDNPKPPTWAESNEDA